MPIADLTGTTWRINEVPVVSQSFQYTIFYTSNNSNYVALVGIPTSPGNYMITYATQSGSPDPDVTAFNTSTGGWNTTGGADYRTIVIAEDQHGQTGVTNPTLIAWLEANAVQVTYPVTISYDGDTIATMSASGTKTLQTAGKYCDGDIEVKYTEPTPSLQNKTVSPATTSQSVTADNGYDGLGTVTVNAISPTKAAATYTPTTSNQTVSAGQWLTGAQTILGDANLTAGNIKKDVSIFNVTGTYEGSGGNDMAPSLIMRHGGTYIYGVSYVGQYAFAGYNATSITLTFPQCKAVHAYAFAYWSYLSSGSRLVSLPQCTSIGSNAFRDFFRHSSSGAVVSVYVPMCSSIDEYAFYDCYRMSIASFPACSVIGPYAFALSLTAGARLSVLSFPQCTEISRHAFENQSALTEVSFPECTKISVGAFTSCTNIVNANFPKCVGLYSSTSTNIGAFDNCTNLTTISFPLLKNIYCRRAFANTHIVSAYLPELISAASGIFARCSYLVSVNLPKATFLTGSTAQMQSPFNGCVALTDVSIPLLRSVTTYGFGGCTALSRIQLPSVAVIDDYGFEGCTALVSASFPICVSILASAFRSCTSLSDVYLPLCASIGTYAFQNCTALQTISLPALQRISNSTAFRGCTRLISLYLMGSSVATLSNSTAFSSTPIGGYSTVAGQYGSIYVPASLLASYKAATGWKLLSARIVGI